PQRSNYLRAARITGIQRMPSGLSRAECNRGESNESQGCCAGRRYNGAPRDELDVSGRQERSDHKRKKKCQGGEQMRYGTALWCIAKRNPDQQFAPSRTETEESEGGKRAQKWTPSLANTFAAASSRKST